MIYSVNDFKTFFLSVIILDCLLINLMWNSVGRGFFSTQFFLTEFASLCRWDLKRAVLRLLDGYTIDLLNPPSVAAQSQSNEDTNKL